LWVDFGNLQVAPKEKFGVYNKQILTDISKDILPKKIYDRKKWASLCHLSIGLEKIWIDLM